MIKLNKNIKKVILILMLAIIVLSSLPITTFAAYITDMNSNAQFGVVSGSLGTYGHELHYATYDGRTYLLFCSQYGETSPSGGTYTYNSQFIAQLNNSSYKKIAEYIYFGYTSKHGDGLPTTVEARRDACATQQFVWEYVRDHIDARFGAPGRDSWNSSYMSSSIYASWLSSTESSYNNYYRGNVSFNGQTLKVDIGESATYTDTNGILSSYPAFTKTISGVTYTHSAGSNNLVVSSNSSNNETTSSFSSVMQDVYRLTPSGREFNKGEMSSYIYFQFTSGAIQNLIFSNYVDPTAFQLNVEVQSGKIQIIKKDDNGTAINGCGFKVYTDNACTQEVRSGNTGNNGTILFDKLKPGTYYIKETTVVNGYLINNTVKSIVVANGQTSNVDFSNSEPTGIIKIHKISEYNDNIKDAEITIEAAETIKNVSGSKTFYTKGQIVSTLKTDLNGLCYIDNLPMGKYLVYESKAPSGYLLNTEKFEANLVYKDSVTPVIEIEMKSIVDNEPRGTVSIVKKDSETGSVPQGDATLEGAVYKLYADEDIFNVAKSIKFYSKGDLVATRTMDAKGNTENITELPLGKYKLKEETPSKGYLLDTTEYEVSLKYKDQYTKIITGSTTSKEQVKKMRVHIFKSGIKSNNGLVPGLEGVEFSIKLLSDVQKALDKGYTYQEIWNGIDEYGNTVNVNSKRVSEAQVIAPTYQKLVTDEDGNAYSKKLPYGKYIVKETKSIKDFYTAEDFTFSIIQDESEIDDVAKKVKDLFVNNEQMESYIKLIKKDADTGKLVTLSSSTFRIKATKDIYDRGNGKILYKKGETITQKVGSTVYDSFTTNAKNIIVPEKSYTHNRDDFAAVVTPLKLEAGSYEIYEILIPEGYLELESPVTFNVEGIRDYDTDNEGDFIREVVVENTKPTGTIIIDKNVLLRDNADTSIVDTSDLSGIEFKLIVKEDIIDPADGSVKYKAGQEIGTYNLTKEGKLEINNLHMGKYELYESKTIDGLVLSDKKYEIEFSQKDTTTKIYNENLEITNETTITEFSKTDITGDKELVGAKLTVLNEQNEVIDTWISTEETHKIEGLKISVPYKLIEEIAPDKFVKSSEIEFKIENTGEIQKVTMVDKVVEIKKTDLVTGEELEGAELIITDEFGNEIDRWVSTKEAHKVTGLEESKTYTLTEITCPYGYEISESITFTVSKEKDTQLIEMKDMPILKTIKIVKLDSTTEEKIYEKFTFGIYEDPECEKLIKEVESEKQDATVTFEDLRYGKYYIKEIKAPKGYNLSERIVEIEINDKGVFADGEIIEEENEAYSIEFYNDLIPVVQTGNETNYLLIIGSIIISVIGIIFGAVLFIKKKQK